MSTYSHPLHKYKVESGTHNQRYCSADESAKFLEIIETKKDLPDGVFSHLANGEYYFYRMVQAENPSSELSEYIACLQYESLQKIKNYLLFFVILTIIGIVGGLISIFL